MAEQTEVLKYKLDPAEAEAGLTRLQQHLSTLKTHRAAGQDTTAIEEEIRKEAAALGALGQAQQKTGGSAEDLLNQKRKLAGVVNMLGGEFGPLINQVGELGQLLMRGSSAALGLAAAFAAIAVGVKIYRELREEAERAKKAQEELNEAVRQQQAAKQEPAQRLTEGLAKVGAATPENVRAAWDRFTGLQKEWGVRDEDLAARATVAGISAEETAVLAAAQRQGMRPAEAPGAMKAQVQILKARGQYDDMLRSAEQWRRTGGADVVSQALVPGARTGPELPTEQRAYEALREAETPVRDVKTGQPLTFAQFREALDRPRRIAELRKQLDEQRAADVGVEGAGGADLFLAREVDRLEKEELLQSLGPVRKMIEQQRRQEAGATFPAAEPLPASVPSASEQRATAAAVTYINTYIEQQENIGTKVGTGGDPRRATLGRSANIYPSGLDHKAE